VRGPEGVKTFPTRKALEKSLVKRPGTPHSQCRGRGFESLHLHQKPRSEGQCGIPVKTRSTVERYARRRRGRSFGSAVFNKGPCSQADSPMFGTVGGAVGRGVSLRVFIDESGARRTHKFGMNGQRGYDHPSWPGASIDAGHGFRSRGPTGEIGSAGST